MSDKDKALFSVGDAKRMAHVVRQSEFNAPPGAQHRRRSVNIGTTIPAYARIAQVTGYGTGGGYYDCGFFQVVNDYWDTQTVPQLTSIDESGVVLNLNEIPIGGDTDSHNLGIGAFILCWPLAKSNGEIGYVGIGAPRYKTDCE